MSVRSMTLAEIGARASVTARRRIEDSPLAEVPTPAAAGATGDVCDVDTANGVVFVDFGGGAIACMVEELSA